MQPSKEVLMVRNTISTRALATAALAGVITFVVIVVALHVIQHGRYHPLSEAVSELALGRGGWLMFVAFSALATGTLCVAVMLGRMTDSKVAPALLALAGGLSYVSAVFHADGENARTTLHGEIHQTAGIITFVLIVAVMCTCWRTFRRDQSWQPLARPALACTVGALVAFFLTPTVGAAYFGLVQRLFLALCLSWLAVVAAYGRRLTADGAERPSAGMGAVVETQASRML
jgi:membrane protein YdbS with pleckstrin-like domain